MIHRGRKKCQLHGCMCLFSHTRTYFIQFEAGAEVGPEFNARKQQRRAYNQIPLIINDGPMESADEPPNLGRPDTKNGGTGTDILNRITSTATGYLAPDMQLIIK